MDSNVISVQPSSVQPIMIKTIMISVDFFDEKVNDLLEKGWSFYSPITYVSSTSRDYHPGNCFVVLYK